MKYKFALLICCIFCLLGQVNAQTYAEKYNLNFQIKEGVFRGWSPDVNNSKLKLSYDSTFFRFSQDQLWGFREKMKLEYHSYKSILLPSEISKTANISIVYKCKNLKTANLQVYMLDSSEKIIRTDSIIMIPTDTMFQISRKIELKNTRFLSFRIIAYGKDSTYTRGLCAVAQTIPHELCLKELQVIVDDRYLNTAPFIDISPLSIDKEECVGLTFDSLCPYNKIPLLSSKKIVALGETVHGCFKIREAVCEVIKYQIIHNKCRLIVFEKPLLHMLFFNKYVQGDDVISTEKLTQLLETDVDGAEPMLGLMKWIRAYNKSTQNEVKIVGMDAFYENNEFPRYANEYLRTINQKLHLSVIDSIMNIWDKPDPDKSKEKAKTTLDILAKNKESLMKTLGEEDFKILRFYLNAMLGVNFRQKNYNLRNRGMFETCSFLIDSMTPPKSSVVIYAHWMHLNYTLDTFPIDRSTGSYMKERYNGDYACIGLSIYQGDIRVYNRHVLMNNRLQVPPPNSLEYILNNLGYEYAYMNTSSLKGFARLRIVGLYYDNQQFETIISPGIQMDGVLFIK